VGFLLLFTFNLSEHVCFFFFVFAKWIVVFIFRFFFNEFCETLCIKDFLLSEGREKDVIDFLFEEVLVPMFDEVITQEI
jgi:hypothetical protein